MSKKNHQTVTCAVCHKDYPFGRTLHAEVVRPGLAELIKRDCPEWSHDSFVCLGDLARYRAAFVKQSLETEKGELSALEDAVVQSMKDEELLTQNINEQFDRTLTMGERMADGVAEFGGSWTFIIAFGTVMVIWIVVNSIVLLNRPFDPYPYILLNLVLSCQAPIIMMSQNREGAKDRLRSENDYRVNLKAEIEIRQLHAKMDQLLMHQWHRLMEIQEIQTELMEELVRRKNT